jgi:outer membrane protein assembly factor BamB
MKSLILIFAAIFISSCSFDNKTGIWQDANEILVDNEKTNSITNSNNKNRYEDIFTKNESFFNKEIKAINNSILNLDTAIKNKNWLEQYRSKTNNTSNFSYKGNNELLSKSSKLSNFSSDKNIIFYNGNLISFDHRGKIFIYSSSLKKKIFEYDFYKKKFKNYKKNIYLMVNKNILYAADNLGYIYAINLNDKSVVWAKNYGIPFRSNLKFIDEQILLSNQDNEIYSINPISGEKNWQFATTTTFLKSNFKNNFAIDEINKNLFFLNTSGELYSINYSNKKVNWVINFKNSSQKGELSLFFSQPVVIKNNNIIISTESLIHNFNSSNGSRKWNFPSDSILKPIITNNYVFILSKHNLLICIQNDTGKVIWSKNIYSNLNIKKISKIGKLSDFKIANKKLNIFSKNGYLLSFNYNNGKLEYMKKISKNGIGSEIIYTKDNMYFIDNSNKLLKFN